MENKHNQKNVTSRIMDKKRNFLDLKGKLKIIERLGSTNSGKTKIAKEFAVSKSTIRRIYKDKENILEKCAKVSDDDVNSALRRKKLNNEAEIILENCVYKWFKQKRSMGEPISGILLQEKARIFNEKIIGLEQFKASRGWLDRFKKRNGLHTLIVQGEKLSADDAASKAFIAQFPKFIEDNGYTKFTIYNADEFGLVWKALPDRTLAADFEISAPGRKATKDRVTVMACANASGTHKIPLLLIGKSKKPRCFKNILSLPVEYQAQKSAWMNSAIFQHWFENIFIPAVKEHQKESKESGPVLLILDNAPTHPPKEELNLIDPMFQVEYLPANVTSLIQPMDQGVIAKTKRLYRTSLLRELLIQRDEQSVTNYIKKLDLKDCCQKIASAWEKVRAENISQAWRKLLSQSDTAEGIRGWSETEQRKAEENMLDILVQIPGYTKCTSEDLDSWLKEDINDPGWEILSDDDILRMSEHGNEIQTQTNEESANQDFEEVEVTPQSADKEVTDQEALEGLAVFQKWFETKWECESKHQLSLEEMRVKAKEIIWSNRINYNDT